MCSLIQNIIISLITGVVSSLCVTLFWQRHIDKKADEAYQKAQRKQQKISYENDIRKTYNHIRKIEQYLKYQKSGTYKSDILKVIDDRISTPSFTVSMNDYGKNIMIRYNKLLKDVKSCVENENLSDEIIDKLYFDLQDLECEFIEKHEQFYSEPII